MLFNSPFFSNGPNFNGASILITGGTGSFGNRCTEMLLERYKPSRLVIFSRDEYKQYEMQQRFTDPCMRFFLGSVRDLSRMTRAFEGIDYVIHAAALKQVPALEYNPIEAVRTNIIGAEHVIQAAISAGVKKVIALSTDKAANPVNLYGATKLASDKLFVAANNTIGKKATQFAVVRYGNVINSRGSVIPFFRQKLAQGLKELPITDERMTRFWITLTQGVEFVFRSFERMQGGELFVPKIPSMNIMDLVRAIAPADVTTKVVGIRPGEKLHEVMCPSETSQNTLEFPDHYVITPAFFSRSASNYRDNAIGERSSPVPQDFAYSSDTNPHFLAPEDIIRLIDEPSSSEQRSAA